MPKKNTIVYIAADSRSGSTLLDLLLGNHSEISSVGELRRLADHYRGFLACTCNSAVDQCEFWQQVEVELNSQGESLREIETLLPRSGTAFTDLLYFLPGVFLRHRPARTQALAAAFEIARNNLKILDAVSKVTVVPVLVDSSKVSKLCRLYNLLRPGQIKTIFLLRDGRGTCYSRKRHGTEYGEAVSMWIIGQVKFFLLRRTIPGSGRLMIRYEDLCEDPETVLREISRFIGVPFQERSIQLVKADRHNICGSEMRFDSADTDIRLDESWRDQLSTIELRLFMYRGAGLVNRLLGYR